MEIKFSYNYRNHKEMKKIIKVKDHKKMTLVYSRNFEAGRSKFIRSVLGPQLVSCQVYAFFPEEVLSILRTIFSSLLVKLIIDQNWTQVSYAFSLFTHAACIPTLKAYVVHVWNHIFSCTCEFSGENDSIGHIPPKSFHM